jgi:prepilin-type N-terminal cleavage/methylation domain-containing protein
MQRHPSRHIVRAFTLIELLTVIAIIAVLAAILFPIFGTVREQTRQSSTLSKMHAIYLGARLFYEDEGRFPPALYGYAETPLTNPGPIGPYAQPAMPGAANITPMDKATGSYTTNTNLIRGYLFGEQVKDYVTFLNDDNIGHTKTQTTICYYPMNLPNPPGTNTIKVSLSNGSSATLTRVDWYQAPASNTATCPLQTDIDFPCAQNEAVPCSMYNGVPKLYYILDSMDISPMVDPYNGKQLVDSSNNPIYELHYTPDWTKQLYDPVNGCDETNGLPNTTQLKYKNPPSENTIITWSTQHVATAGSNSALILLADGTSRKIDFNIGIKQLPLQYNK